MRTIKFRAWDKENGMQSIAAEDLQSAEFNLFVPNAVLMQYTGLKDKNGKEIYEGDIIQTPMGWVASVFYDNNNVCFCLDTDDDYNPCIGRYEVIGNIYENPELLK